MRREPALFLTRSHIRRRGTEPMIDTVEPIGIVGTQLHTIRSNPRAWKVPHLVGSCVEATQHTIPVWVA